MRLKVDERARKEVLEAGVDCWLPPLLHLASMGWRRRQRGEGGGEWQVRGQVGVDDRLSLLTARQGLVGLCLTHIPCT